MQFMHGPALIIVCLEEGGMNNKQVGGRLWGNVCREWWDRFAKMCVYAWQTEWLLRGGSEGYANVVYEWAEPTYSYHGLSYRGCICGLTRCMFWPASGYLSKISCFATEGSHRRLKCMLHNNRA